MTEPLPGMEPVPLAPPAEPIEGDSHRHLITPLQALGRELGYGVEIQELPDEGPGGWCDPTRRQIVVASGPANRQVRTLVPWRKGGYLRNAGRKAIAHVPLAAAARRCGVRRGSQPTNASTTTAPSS